MAWMVHSEMLAAAGDYTTTARRQQSSSAHLHTRNHELQLDTKQKQVRGRPPSLLARLGKLAFISNAAP